MSLVLKDRLTYSPAQILAGIEPQWQSPGHSERRQRRPPHGDFSLFRPRQGLRRQDKCGIPLVAAVLRYSDAELFRQKNGANCCSLSGIDDYNSTLGNETCFLPHPPQTESAVDGRSGGQRCLAIAVGDVCRSGQNFLKNSSILQLSVVARLK